MKNIFFAIIALLAISCGGNITPIPTPNPNSYAKQIGLVNVDTASEWVYQTVVYFANGDSTQYTQSHFVEDTANIQGKAAFLVRVESPYGLYYYKVRTDSTGTEIERGSYINKYQYPSLDTFYVNTSGCQIFANILSLDSTITIAPGAVYPNTIVYYSPMQLCSIDEATVCYQYGIGLVGSIFVGSTATTKQYLVSYK